LLITLAPEDESPIVQPGQEDCCHQDADRDSERVAEIERERRWNILVWSQNKILDFLTFVQERNF